MGIGNYKESFITAKTTTTNKLLGFDFTAIDVVLNISLYFTFKIVSGLRDPGNCCSL